MNVQCTWSLQIVSDRQPAVVAEEVERVMDHLLDLEQADPRITDSAVGLDLGTMTVEISLGAEGSTLEEAVSLALASMRAAIHTAGGVTAEWPSVSQVIPGRESLASSISFRHGNLVVT